MRKLRAGALVVIVLAATSALAGSATAASKFQSSAAETELVAGQATEHKLTFNTGVVVCEKIHLTSLMTEEEAAALQFDPTLTGCEFEGLFEVAVSVNGCELVLRPSSATEGTLEIGGCGENEYIQIGSLSTCRVRLPEQSNLTTLGFEEVGNNLLVSFEVTGIEYEESGTSCAGSGVKTNGTYTGSSEIAGNGGEADLSISVVYFHSSHEEIELAAGQVVTHALVNNTGVVVCEEVHLTASMAETTAVALELAPTFTGCEFQELFSITINANGCELVLRPSSATEGTLDIAGCNEGAPYIQTGSPSTCRVRLLEQSGLGVLGFEEVGNNLLVTFEVGGIKYTEVGLFCAGGPVENGTYTGSSEIEGNGGEADLWVE